VTSSSETAAQDSSEVRIKFRLSEKDIELVATRVAELVSQVDGPTARAWLDVEGAAVHLGMSAHASGASSSDVRFRLTALLTDDSGSQRPNLTNGYGLDLRGDPPGTYHDRP
jgi:hypothetical protein